MSGTRTWGWIGVDLDGTLAFYDRWSGVTEIGAPIPEMVERVQAWLKEGREVKIFTARVSHPEDTGVAQQAIERWCIRHLGTILEVTCIKDHKMVELWDDRCVQVVTNTGRPITECNK